MRLSAPDVEVVIDLVAGGRIASFVVDGRELLRTSGCGFRSRGGRSRWHRAPAGSATPRSTSTDGRTTCRSTSRHTRSTGPSSIGAGSSSVMARSRRTSGRTGRSRGRSRSSASSCRRTRLTCRLEVHCRRAVMPASIGWHPWFIRRLEGVAGELELDLDAGAMYVRDDDGIATTRRVPRPPGPWDDCFTDVRRPPRAALARLPGADDRIGLSGLGRLHRAGGCALRGTADGAARRAQWDAGDRRARPAAGRRDDLALAVARRLTDQPPVWWSP